MLSLMILPKNALVFTPKVRTRCHLVGCRCSYPHFPCVATTHRKSSVTSLKSAPGFFTTASRLSLAMASVRPPSGLTAT